MRLSGPAAVQQYAVQIGPMDHRIGIAEAFAEILAQGDVGDLLATHRIHEAEHVDIDRLRPRGVADTQIVEGVEGVGAKLDAGADLAERRAFSSTTTSYPLAAMPRAAASPPMPPPAIRMGRALMFVSFLA